MSDDNSDACRQAGYISPLTSVALAGDVQVVSKLIREGLVKELKASVQVAGHIVARVFGIA
jgi:hypothetical protein